MSRRFTNGMVGSPGRTVSASNLSAHVSDPSNASDNGVGPVDRFSRTPAVGDAALSGSADTAAAANSTAAAALPAARRWPGLAKHRRAHSSGSDFSFVRAGRATTASDVAAVGDASPWMDQVRGRCVYGMHLTNAAHRGLMNGPPCPNAVVRHAVYRHA